MLTQSKFCITKGIIFGEWQIPDKKNKIKLEFKYDSSDHGKLVTCNMQELSHAYVIRNAKQ